MTKNILVIAAITSASFAMINLGSSSPSLAKASTSTVAWETWSEVKQTSSSKEEEGYTGNNEDGESEEIPKS